MSTASKTSGFSTRCVRWHLANSQVARLSRLAVYHSASRRAAERCVCVWGGGYLPRQSFRWLTVPIPISVVPSQKDLREMEPTITEEAISAL